MKFKFTTDISEKKPFKPFILLISLPLGLTQPLLKAAAFLIDQAAFSLRKQFLVQFLSFHQQFHVSHLMNVILATGIIINAILMTSATFQW